MPARQLCDACSAARRAQAALAAEQELRDTARQVYRTYVWKPTRADKRPSPLMEARIVEALAHAIREARDGEL